MTAVRVREAELTDLEPVDALMRSVGWAGTTRRDWDRMWVENPALRDGGADVSKGWVLEAGSRIAGFIANVQQRYSLEGRRIRATSAGALVVAPEFRGHSLKLVTAYTRQREFDLLLNTTAATHVTPIFEFLKFDRIPQADYDRSLYWVLRPRRFLAAAFRRRRVPAAAGGLLAAALAPWLQLALVSTRRLPRERREPPTRILRADEIGPEFDDLWQRQARESDALLAERSAETLRWHFGRQSWRRPPFLVAAHRDDRLVGYLAVVHQDVASVPLRRARIADLCVERDDPGTIRALLGACVAQARREDADIVELLGFPRRVRRVAEEFRPLRFAYPGWPFLYKALAPGLGATLASPDRWRACLFDGDGCL